jgi:hypothetical protein
LDEGKDDNSERSLRRWKYSVLSVKGPPLLILGGIVILIKMLFVWLFKSIVSTIVAVQNHIRCAGLIVSWWKII